MGLYLWLEEVWSKFLAATVNDFLNNINWFFFLFNVLQDHAPTQRILGSGYSVTGVGDEPLLNMYKPWWLFTLQNTVEWYPVLFCHRLFCRHSRKNRIWWHILKLWIYSFNVMFLAFCVQFGEPQAMLVQSFVSWFPPLTFMFVLSICFR